MSIRSLSDRLAEIGRDRPDQSASKNILDALGSAGISVSDLIREALGSRDVFAHPYSRHSPWNTPIGSDAQFAPLPAEFHAMPGSISVNFNGQFTCAIVKALESDPLGQVRFTPGAGTTQYVTRTVAAVFTGSNVVDTTVSHNYVSGLKVQVASTGTPPAPLEVETDYYFGRTDHNTGGFATSLANARAGTFIDLTDAGTGTHTIVPQWTSHSAFYLLAQGVCENYGNDDDLEGFILDGLLPNTIPLLPIHYHSTVDVEDPTALLAPPEFHSAQEDFRTRIRLPLTAQPSGPADSDGHISVQQPDGWALEASSAIMTTSRGPILVCTHASMVDLRGDGTGFWNGMRASMVPASAGLIRHGEFAGGNIPHALIAYVGASVLSYPHVWPAYAFDRSPGYSGSVPIGALAALPPSFDIEGSELSAQGKVFARACQRYGILFLDRSGGGMVVNAEHGNTEMDVANWASRAADMTIIRAALQRVTNNGPQSVGGGGAPVTDRAFPL